MGFYIVETNHFYIVEVQPFSKPVAEDSWPAASSGSEIVGHDGLLGAFEELVMLSVAHEGDTAYGMRVRRELERRSGRGVTIGAVYATLDRLQSKGLVESQDRTGEAAGRARRYFELTPDGARALLDARRVHDSMWEGVDLAALGSRGQVGR